MKYFFDQDISKMLKTKKRMFLFLDYDGTLSPIVKDPSCAYLSNSVKKLLRQLSRKNNLVLGIISGRSLSDIKRRVGISSIVYSGNHGLEFYFRGKKILAEKLKSLHYLNTLKLAKKELKGALSSIEGVVFEDKGLIFTVHYRKVKPQRVRKIKVLFKKAITPFLLDKQLKVTEGKKVLEIRPNISCSKADAVNFFQRQFKKKKNEVTIFIGDDLTDEDVFRELKNPDIGIRVGRKLSSGAKYFLKSTKGVERLLAHILEYII